MILDFSLDLLLAIGLITAVLPTVAAKPHSVPIVIKPAHQYSHSYDPSAQALFHPFTSAPDTPVPSWTLKAVPTTVYRPRSLQDAHDTPWDPTEMLGPDVEDRHTLSQLARISGNAYMLPGRKSWYDIDSAWNIVSRHLPRMPHNLMIMLLQRAFLSAGKTAPQAFVGTSSCLPTTTQ